MANFGNIIGIGYRIIAHRQEIMKIWDTLVPLVRSVTGAYPDIIALVDKIAPGMITPTEVPELAKGEHEADGEHYSITWLQESLNALEHAGLEADGDMGDATKEAVTAFQTKHGLKVDGWAGGDTVAKIVAELDKA
jgi:peptidoglycan hydrolase-like protein with peptidoglycan-binding domain